MFAVVVNMMKKLNFDTHDLYQKIRAAYEQQKLINDPVTFLSEEEIKLPAGKELHQVMTIRHGDPLLKKKGWTDYRGARNWVKGYDTVGIESVGTLPVKLVPEEVGCIYSSSIPRAKATAYRLFCECFNIIEDYDYRELERLVPAVPFIRLPLTWWLVIARIPWVIGWPGMESLQQGRKRSSQIAQFLDQEAKKEQKVVLVAHGFLNRFIHRRLKRKGWRRVRHEGHGFLAVSVFAMVIDQVY